MTICTRDQYSAHETVDLCVWLSETDAHPLLAVDSSPSISDGFLRGAAALCAAAASERGDPTPVPWLSFADRLLDSGPDCAKLAAPTHAGGPPLRQGCGARFGPIAEAFERRMAEEGRRTLILATDGFFEDGPSLLLARLDHLADLGATIIQLTLPGGVELPSQGQGVHSRPFGGTWR